MTVQILNGDWIERMRDLPDASVQMVGPTSPPYMGLRDYGVPGQVGQEAAPEEFVDVMVRGFREARRILRPDGVFVLNLGDSMSGSGKGPTGKNGIGNQQCRQGFHDEHTYHGIPPKNLLMIPFRVALALQADGWILRSVIPWVKRNPMPESVTDRPATAVEYLFLFSRQGRYYWDSTAIRQDWADARQGRDSARAVSVRNVGGRSDGYTKPNGIDPSANGGRSYRNSDAFFQSWQGLMLDETGDPLALVVNPKPNRLAHFASFPDTLVQPFIRAGTSERGQCPACGAPWARVVEREPGFQARRVTEGGLRGRRTGAATDSDYRGVGYTRATDLGWASSCACVDAGDPVPCTVLDPFLGSGTTALVADQLGRDCIGIELNADYAEMARRRIANDAPMLTADAVTVTTGEQPALFEVAS